MRILLISPPFYRIIGFYNRYFPFGLTALGAALSARGHAVTVYDADFSAVSSEFDYARLPEKYAQYLASLRDQRHPVWREVEQTIRDLRPDIVGISVYTTFAAAALRVAEIARQALPSCTVVAGGPHATAKAEEMLRIAPEIDYVISGDGEEALAGLARYLEKKQGECASIPGLSFREGGTVRHTPKKCIEDIDALPCPGRALLLQEKKYAAEDMGLIMTTRGCPYRCTFCASDNQRVSYRSVEKVIDEMRGVYRTYGTRQFTVKDDSFTVNAQRVAAFCDGIARSKMNIRWECNTRVGLVTASLLRTMKKAGCNFIKIGIESGSEKILKKMNKGITIEQIRETARLLREAGIHWTGYFMMGVPGETEDDVLQTLALMREIRPDMALLGVYEPFPGTALFDEGVARGTLKPAMTKEDFFSTLPNQYYKKDPRTQTDAISPERFALLENDMKRQFHAYNTRFGNVLKMGVAKSRVYFSQPVSMVADIKKYLSYK